MKNVLMILAVAFVSVTAVSAQDRTASTTTKDGVAILPAAGDFALGVDAAPFLKYIGGLFSDQGATAPSFQGQFTGQYFLTESTSVRAKLGLQLTSTSTKTLQQDVTSKDPEKKVTDVEKLGDTKINLGVDYLFHRGYGRLQGYYGGGLSLGYASKTTTNEYGNIITSTYQDTRTLKDAAGSVFSFGLDGVIGVEYFVAPKISVGAEFNAALNFSNAAKGKRVSESWNADSKVKEESTEEYYSLPGSSSFNIAPNAGVFLNFYF